VVYVNGVLSLIFSGCVLPGLLLTSLRRITDVSYNAYADEILLISRCKCSLSRTVQKAKKVFLDIGLYLNLEKL